LLPDWIAWKKDLPVVKLSVCFPSSSFSLRAVVVGLFLICSQGKQVAVFVDITAMTATLAMTIDNSSKTK